MQRILIYPPHFYEYCTNSGKNIYLKSKLLLQK